MLKKAARTLLVAGLVGAAAVVLVWVQAAGALSRIDFSCQPSCTAVAGTKITFIASSDASKPSYSWDLHGGNPPVYDDASGPTASSSFPTPGTYPISLQVVDTASKQALTITHQVTVTAPKVDFTCSPSCAVRTGTTVTFSARSDALQPGYGWSLRGENPPSYGDATGPSTSESFANPGTYTVSVQVTDAASGLTAGASHDVTVTPALPKPVPIRIRLGFDDRAPGARVARDAGGITFPQRPYVIRPAVRTASPANALSAPKGSSHLDICFSDPARGVSMSVGFQDRRAPAKGTWARLVGYDKAGKQIASSRDKRLAGPGKLGAISTRLSISTQAYDVSCATIYVGRGTRTHDTGGRTSVIDNATLLTQAREPSVQIHSPEDGASFLQGDLSAVSGLVFAPSGFQNFCVVQTAAPAAPASPPDWSQCPNPNVIPGHRGEIGPDGAFTVLLLPSPGVGTTHLTAWVRSTDGQVARDDVTITVTLPPPDIQLNGMEITQGIQSIPLATQVSGGARSVPYNGVQLVANRPAWVIVYANTTGPRSLVAHNVTAVLHVLNHGRELAGSPLLPTGGPIDLAPGPATVSLSTRSGLTGAYVFKLPLEMLQGDLTLRADVNPVPRTVTECCYENNTFEITNVRPRQGAFPGSDEEITPLAVVDRVDGVLTAPSGFDPSDPASRLSAVANYELASRAFPLSIDVAPYQATIDATSVIHDPTHDNPWKNDSTNDLVSNFQRDTLHCHDHPYVVGIAPAADGFQVYGVTIPHYCFPFSSFTDSVVQEARPLTSVAHEMGHFEGLSHASADPLCYATQPGIPWPPDQHGYIQGVGFEELAPNSYEVLAPGDSPRPLDPSMPLDGPAYAGQYFDLMSYCANPGPDNDAWISTRYWNNLIDAHGFGPPGGFSAAAPERVDNLEAMVGSGSDTGIVSLTPGIGTPKVVPSAASPYHAVALGKAGAVISDTPLAAQPAHVDRGPQAPAAPFIAVSGAIPALDHAASVSLYNGNALLATRSAPPDAPGVRVLSPHHGQLIKATGAVLVRWSTSNPDRVALDTTIEYSADGGRHYKMIELGTTGNQFSLPGWYFTTSRNARVRISVTDGFHEAVAVSSPFRSTGVGPAVRITSPTQGGKVRADTPLDLAGEAFDENNHPLTGKRLTWYLGKHGIGHGARLSVSGLPAGRQVIRLVARDRRGRTGSDSTVMIVRPVTPTFIFFRAPGTVSPKLKFISLRVASSVVASLRISGRGAATRLTLDRRVRLLRIRVKRGASLVVLKLTLRSRGAPALRVRLKIQR